MKKDKEKVLDEVWTEARVKDFLHIESVEDCDADFHVLLKAYQSMREENFEQFVDFFLAQGRNINARNPQGQTVLSIVLQHRSQSAYADILSRHSAES